MKKVKICQCCFEEPATHDNLCDGCYAVQQDDEAMDVWDKYVIGSDSTHRGYMHQSLKDLDDE